MESCETRAVPNQHWLIFAEEHRIEELWIRELAVPGTELIELTVAMVER